MECEKAKRANAQRATAVLQQSKMRLGKEDREKDMKEQGMDNEKGVDRQEGKTKGTDRKRHEEGNKNIKKIK